MTIIGISGKIGSGKTTLARVLYTHFGYEPKIFAGKLKEIASILTGLHIDNMYQRHMKDTYLDMWGMTIGELQQRLGTEAVRDHLHKDAWINALFADYFDQNWSVSDMRFENEAEAILDRGGILVRIDGSRTGPGGRDPNHISETSLDEWDLWHYVFDNNGTLADLVEHARNIHAIAQATRLS